MGAGQSRPSPPPDAPAQVARYADAQKRRAIQNVQKAAQDRNITTRKMRALSAQIGKLESYIERRKQNIAGFDAMIEQAAVASRKY